MRESLPALPVVVVSAADDAKSVLAALDLGAMGYIPKTSPREVLLGAVRLVAAGGIYVPLQAVKAEEVKVRAAAGPVASGLVSAPQPRKLWPSSAFPLDNARFSNSS